ARRCQQAAVVLLLPLQARAVHRGADPWRRRAGTGTRLARRRRGRATRSYRRRARSAVRLSRRPSRPRHAAHASRPIRRATIRAGDQAVGHPARGRTGARTGAGRRGPPPGGGAGARAHGGVPRPRVADRRERTAARRRRAGPARALEGSGREAGAGGGPGLEGDFEADANPPARPVESIGGVGEVVPGRERPRVFRRREYTVPVAETLLGTLEQHAVHGTAGEAARVASLPVLATAEQVEVDGVPHQGAS